MNLRRQTMQFLLLDLWVRLEAPEHGIGVSEREVDRAFRLARSQAFPNARAFRAFLRRSKMTEADARFQVRFNELYAKLRRHATRRARTAAGKQRLDDRFNRALRRKWRARTACGLRYKSSQCSQVVAIEPSVALP